MLSEATKQTSRRQVTLLACSISFVDQAGRDRVGVTPDREIEIECQRRLLQSHDLIARFKGKVVGKLGDCFLAVFGLPSANDSDARQAAQAALQILQKQGR